MPSCSPRVAFVCRVLLGLSTLWFVGVAAWEMGGPFGPGHYAAGPSFAVAAENSLRFHEAGPVPTHLLTQPPLPSEIYCHHPWGFYWLMTLCLALFGQHDWVVRLPAVLLSGASVPLLYGLARALWGPVSGAVAALAFVTLPITLAFCNLSNLEVPTIFGMLLSAWAGVRFLQAGERHHFVLALCGSAFAAAMDWPGSLFLLLWLAALTLGALGFREARGGADRARCVELVTGSALVLGSVLALSLGWFAKLGQLPELWSSGRLRSTGSELPILQVLEARRYWIELSFTWLAIGLGKLMLPVLGLRIVLLRRPLEASALAVLGAAAFHYLVFKNGADVHVFWSHYFAPYYALALAGLAATLPLVLAWFGRRFQFEPLASLAGARAELLGLALGLLPSLVIARDGVAALVYARLTGGRFDEHGRLIQADKDKVAFMEWLAPRLPLASGARIDLGMKPSLWMSWSLQHPLSPGAAPFSSARGAEQFFLLDARFVDGHELRRLADSFGAEVAGPFWAFDRANLGGDLHGFAIRRRAPAGFERYWRSGLHDLQWVEPSSLYEWELRDHFSAHAPRPPDSAAHDIDELRILHNLAHARGDEPRAAQLLHRLLQQADQRVATDYDDGSRLLGVLRERRAVRVFFRAAGPSPGDRHFRIFSRVVRPLAWSLVPRDTQLREVGLASPIPSSAWKGGYVYSLCFDLLERPGTEELWGAFAGLGAPKALGRTEPVVLGLTR